MNEINSPKTEIARCDESEIEKSTTSHSDSNKRNYHVKWLIYHKRTRNHGQPDHDSGKNYDF